MSDEGKPVKSKRWLYGILLFLTLANLGWYIGEGLHRRTDMVTADPYYYLRFARNLSEGKFHIDGVVADLTRQYAEIPEAGKAANGPIWNTSIKSDGRMVYTIAMGYSLWLSLMLKVGGMGLCTISNFLLWGVVFTLVILLVRESLGRSFAATVAGCCAAMMIPLLDYRTFAQMTDLWREPLFFSCLLTALYGFTRFQRTEKTLPLLFMAFGLGYACSIKEANALHLPLFGLGLLLLPVFRNKKMLPRILLMGVFFVLGASPILFQNYMASGNPLKSLQAVRATTAHLEQPGHGLHPTNIPFTLKGYMNLYVWQGKFAVWWLLVVLAGVAVMWKRPVGRLLATMSVVHVLLYLMWGNPDFRHMYFMVLPCAIFSAAAVVWLFQHLIQLKGLNKIGTPLLLIIPIYMAATHPPKWPYQYKYEDPLRSGDAVRFSHFLSQHVEQPALLISHRFVRDIIGTYTDIEVVRLTELEALFTGWGKDIELPTVIDDMRAKGVNWYYLDNKDLDPKSKNRRNLIERDQRELSWKHQLKEVARAPASNFQLASMAQGEDLRLFEVRPCSESEEVSLTVPDGGASFLYLDAKAAYTNVEVRVDGEIFAENLLRTTRYLPSHELPPGTMVTVHSIGAGLPEMDEANLRWVSWDEKIRVRFGEDVHPADLFYWKLLGEDGVSDRYTSRPFFNRYRLDLPLREGPDFFSLIGLRVGKIWRDREGEMPADHIFETAARFIEPREEAFTIRGNGNSDWIPVPASPRTDAWSGTVQLESDVPPEFITKLSFADIETVYRRMEIPIAPGTRAVGLMGQLVPDGRGQEAYPWQMTRDDTLFREGECLPDIKEAQNRLRDLFPIEPGQEKLVIAFEGAGLLAPKVTPVQDRVLVEPHTPTRAFMTSGFYASDHDADDWYAWTKGRAIVSVPVDPAMRTYQLTLTSRIGLHMRPGEKKEGYEPLPGSEKVHVNAGLFNADITMSDDVSTQTITVEVPEGVGPVLGLEFTTPAWQPSQTFPDNQDERELGFQFYSLDWQPVE